MGALASVIDYFNDVDNDEILRLREHSITICRRVEGRESMNVAAGEGNLGNTYENRAIKAQAANDLDREMANVELSLPHFREAARIYKAINHVDNANKPFRHIADLEVKLSRIRVARAAATRK